MRHSDAYRLSKQLLPHLQGFTTNKKDILFIAPIDQTLRGFLFETSGYKKENFYFWWFFMPIGRPIDHLTLSYGARLDIPSGHASWRIDMDNLPEKILSSMRPMALPFLQSIHTHQHVIDAIHKRAGKQAQTDTNILDDMSCIQILNGRYEEARRTLDSLILQEFGDDRRQWILDIVARAKSLREKLLKDPNLAFAQVREWQDFTFKALKLEEWR
jgi:hypothetical protein